MKTTEQWLERKLRQYESEPETTLEEILSSTNSLAKQYLTSGGLAAKSVLESCVYHNDLFLKILLERETEREINGKNKIR